MQPAGNRTISPCRCEARWWTRQSTCWRIWSETKRPCVQLGTQVGEGSLKALRVQKNRETDVSRSSEKVEEKSQCKWLEVLRFIKRKKKLAHIVKGKEKRQSSQNLDHNAWGRTCVTYQFLQRCEWWIISSKRVLSGSRCTAAQTSLQYLYREARMELLSQTYEQFPLRLHTADKYGNYAASLAAAAQTPLHSRLHPTLVFQAGDFEQDNLS